MKRIKYLLLLLAVTALVTVANAQTINGDLNHSGKLEVSDVTRLINNYLTGSAEVIGTEPFAVDNSRIVGTWYKSYTDSITFYADGTTNYADGYTYEFIPLQGGILFYNRNGVPVDVFKVYKATSDFMVVVPNGSAELVVYTKTGAPSPEVPSPSYVEATAIRFQFQDKISGGTTRAPMRKAPALNDRKYGVFGCYSLNETINTGSNVRADFMFNQEVCYDGTSRTYLPIKYWPRSDQGNNYVSFFAYSPYSGNGSEDVVSVNRNTLEPIINYQSKNPMDDSADLLYGNLLNATQQDNDGVVLIQSKHALSRLNFKAVLDESQPSGTKFTVKSIEISGQIPAQCSFNLLTEKWIGTSAGMQTYAVDGDDVSSDLRDMGNVSASMQPDGVKTYSKPVGKSPLLLIPTSGEQDITMTVRYCITTDDAYLPQGFSRIENVISRTIKLALQSGYNYDILFTLGLTSMRCSVTTSAWDDYGYIPISF